jgi:molybdopterin molybdotransferase
VAPVLAALAGNLNSGPRFALARLAPDSNKHGKPNFTRFLPASCTFQAMGGQLPEVAPVPCQGSGDVAAMARSNCFLVLPEDAHHPEPGAIVRILLKDPA